MPVFSFHVRFRSNVAQSDCYLSVDTSKANTDEGYFGETCIVPKNDPLGASWRVEVADGSSSGSFTGTAFHLYHAATGGLLCWRGFSETAVVASVFSTQATTGAAKFPAQESLVRFDRIGSRDVGKDSPTVYNPQVAINNHDRTHVLDVTRGRTAKGTPVIVWTWNSNSNQIWYVEPLDTPPADFHA